MSINGHYARLAPTDLGRALADPDVAEELTGHLAATGDRLHEVGPYWDAIAFLLRRHGFPVDLVDGGAELPGVPGLGYGPPRYLTPDQVRCVVGALDGISADTLAEGLSGAELTAAEVYPIGFWERDGALDSAVGAYQDLARFLRTAARYRQAVLFWTA
ncbi:YfbM family protein [Kitasatospora sp. NPDC096147]|uniref:YfbM family protein n=1 Tax=Kitasatospora sp. NPDC096147 TaxID=3364093 RepID=UPI00382E4280